MRLLLIASICSCVLLLFTVWLSAHLVMPGVTNKDVAHYVSIETERGPRGPSGLPAAPVVASASRSDSGPAATQPLATEGECVWARTVKRGKRPNISRTKHTLITKCFSFCETTKRCFAPNLQLVSMTLTVTFSFSLFYSFTSVQIGDSQLESERDRPVPGWLSDFTHRLHPHFAALV